MAENVIKLKVDSSEYEGKIKRATQGLVHLEQNLAKTGKTFNQADKDALKYVRALGSFETVSTDVRGKVNELSAAFVNLTSVYNRMSEADKNSDIGRALSKSLGEIRQRAIDAKRELSDLNNKLDTSTNAGGGLFGKMGGAMQVFAGNMYTKAAEAAMGFASEIKNCISEGIELARQGEGIRTAFERLGRGDILQGLRDATHGTVTDIELMKAAVKFNDFKLPLDELGTMLAFAQKKAKDTGEGVDFMVNSIVTGLGRKSLLILDNLGLSANEIKDKMKETGDMTKAVGEIIREQMAKAGEYVETAADRATQANVSLQNKMEELGRKFSPIEEASSQLWTSMKIAILDLVGGPLAKLLNGLTEAGRMRNMLEEMNGSGGDNPTKVDSQISTLKGSSVKDLAFNTEMSRYNKQISDLQGRIEGAQKALDSLSGNQGGVFATKNLRDTINRLKAQRDALTAMRDEYRKRAQDVLTPSDSGGGGGGNGGGGGGGNNTPPPIAGSIDWQTKKVQDLQKAWRAAADDDSRKKIAEQIKEAQAELDKMQGKELPAGSVAALNQEMAKLKKEQEQVTSHEGWVELQRKINNLKFTISDLKGGMTQGVSISDSISNGITNREKELKTGKIDFSKSKLPNAKDFVNQGKEAEKSWNLAAQAVANVGNAFAGIEDPGFKAAGTVIQAIASIALGFAQSSVMAASLGPYAWIAHLAAGAAAMATTISTIHSLTGYSEGGQIKGTTYSGDLIRANGGTIGLNAGEVVLNQAQTGIVASALQGATAGWSLDTELRGEDLRIMLVRNWQRRGRASRIAIG